MEFVTLANFGSYEVLRRVGDASYEKILLVPINIADGAAIVGRVGDLLNRHGMVDVALEEISEEK